MTWSFPVLPVPQRLQSDEWLDDLSATGIGRETLAHSLAEVHQLNRLVGGTRMVRRYVAPMLPASSATLLDVGTGAADTPVALLDWARRARRLLDITGLDVSPQILDVASQYVGRRPITLILGDARALPFPDASFDVVTCLGVLHHFDEREAVQVLREMWRVARVGIVVADLERSYLAYLIAQLALHTIVRNPLTRHDGLISVMRAYTAPELQALARDAGLMHAAVHRRPPFLQTLVACTARASVRHALVDRRVRGE